LDWRQSLVVDRRRRMWSRDGEPMAIRSEARRALEHARQVRAATEQAIRERQARGDETQPRPEVVWLRLATLSVRALRELDRIVDAAIDLADRDGLEALSMRRLAAD